MTTDKPRIAILMAVFEPRIAWFREQLASLNAQTYPNLKLYVRDDCSNRVLFEEIEQCVREEIREFEYEISRSDSNLGSNATFEYLTQEAEGEYYAYCDQDDIWMPQKLEMQEKIIRESQILLVCSDMDVIDAAGYRIAGSITRMRRHQVFQCGAGLAENLLTRNFVTGCTMLVKAESAKNAVPFCPHMLHDHYIALCCAAQGEIYSSPEKMIRYRLHGNNQTGVMLDVTDKQTYLATRIEVMERQLRWLAECFPYRESLLESLNRRLMWVQARKENWTHRNNLRALWSLRSYGKHVTLYEIVASRLPEWLFLWTIQLAQKNIL